ncbi:MAG: type I-E CRISPR-associated protein Cas7/Cse4/CasC [Endomicrobiales bacterium]|nr:type I-E CRISPR-associated protein Cas7/Cse4/CasC [Endomicrobiales bacterium]
MSQNQYNNLIVEFHILQSFPVTCLNRDDVGAPKTAIVGGVTRARVSSQCWKRQVRLAMHEFGATIGTRTKLISDLIFVGCKSNGASDKQARDCGDKVEQIFIKKAKDSTLKKAKKQKDTDVAEEIPEEDEGKDKTDTLLFFSPKEVEILAKLFKENGFKPDAVITETKPDKQAKELAKIIGKYNQHADALDIALFGRMVAQAAEMNVEAAASFSHAISTHKVTNEVEFFTALDDNQTEQGSAHMGSLEFNAATYYRYVSLNVGQLSKTLIGNNIKDVIATFIKALYVAVPNARQTTQSGASPWEFARILVRKGQRLQVPFETPVAKAVNGGFIENSKTALCYYLDKNEKLAGSLFGKVKSFDFGVDENFNVDKLIESINTAIA